MARTKKETSEEQEKKDQAVTKNKPLVFSCNVFHNGIEYKKGEEFKGQEDEELKKFLE